MEMIGLFSASLGFQIRRESNIQSYFCKVLHFYNFVLFQKTSTMSKTRKELLL